MKIAKKVLAVVMALAMVGCFAAMAFAADAPAGAKFVLKAKGDNKVTFNMTNLVGLESANITINYNDAITKVKVKPGKDLMAVNNSGTENAFMGATNTKDAGKVLVGILFTENLYSSEKWIEDCDTEINGEDFECYELTLEFAEGKSMKDAELSMEVTSCNYDKVECVNIKAEADKPAEETTKPAEETTKPAEESTKAPETTKPAGTTEAGSEDHHATGDAGIIGIAVGVVALAGAAFVIAKKRK